MNLWCHAISTGTDDTVLSRSRTGGFILFGSHYTRWY